MSAAQPPEGAHTAAEGEGTPVGAAQIAARSAARGMVLIAVLWIVAALAILVTGMSRAVRGEARTATAARQLVNAAAQGDAAIHLALQTLAAGPALPVRLSVLPTRYHEQAIDVQILPLNGLIDLNRATPALLARLFMVAAGLEAGQAQALAKAAADWRALHVGGGSPRGFEAAEDLLRVPGIDYDLYATIAPLITADVDAAGSGRVNPMAAPEAVLTVLANGDAVQALRIAAQRNAGASAIDTTGLTGEFIDSAATRRLRLQARVALPQGGRVFVARSVEFLANFQNSQDSREGLPWRSFRVEHRLEPNTDANPM